MELLFILLCLVFISLANITALKNKKLLNDQQLIEYERKVRPKVVVFAFLGMTPMLILAVFLMLGFDYRSYTMFVLVAIAIIIFYSICYFTIQRFILTTKFPTEFSYILKYFIFSAIGQLFLLLTMVSTLKKYFI